jgi:plastocyanin
MATLFIVAIPTTAASAQQPSSTSGSSNTTTTASSPTTTLSMTGQQYFPNGTALAYFNDGTISEFEHEMTPAKGYYYDNSTIFYFGEVPGISSADNIKCGENTTSGDNNSSGGELIEATIISGANVIENKSRAIQPSSVITINAGDTLTWVNEDFGFHIVSMPPRGLIITGGIPSEEIFSAYLTNQSQFSCTFTEPGGFHYDIDNANNGIVGTVIVVEEENNGTSTEQEPQQPPSSPSPFSQELQSQP